MEILRESKKVRER